MKFSKSDYNILKVSILETIKRIGKEKILTDYNTGNIPRYDRVKDINKRLRWDLYWSVHADVRDNFQIDGELKYDDSHVDTALKKIMKEENMKIANLTSC